MTKLRGSCRGEARHIVFVVIFASVFSFTQLSFDFARIRSLVVLCHRRFATFICLVPDQLSHTSIHFARLAVFGINYLIHLTSLMPMSSQFAIVTSLFSLSPLLAVRHSFTFTPSLKTRLFNPFNASCSKLLLFEGFSAILV